jgi:hypothetical protein
MLVWRKRGIQFGQHIIGQDFVAEGNPGHVGKFTLVANYQVPLCLILNTVGLESSHPEGQDVEAETNHLAFPRFIAINP